jgi:hypothetical protein
VAKVSVIVPVFEPGALIEPLLDSLLSQTMPAAERARIQASACRSKAAGAPCARIGRALRALGLRSS